MSEFHISVELIRMRLNISWLRRQPCLVFFFFRPFPYRILSKHNFVMHTRTDGRKYLKATEYYIYGFLPDKQFNWEYNSMYFAFQICKLNKKLSCIFGSAFWNFKGKKTHLCEVLLTFSIESQYFNILYLEIFKMKKSICLYT